MMFNDNFNCVKEKRMKKIKEIYLNYNKKYEIHVIF